MRSLARLIERQIAKARAQGKLSDLQGEGKPLPDRPVETSDQVTLFAGYRIMAKSGVLPEEFISKKQLDNARSAYAILTDPVAQKSKLAEIADLELRTNIACEARRKFQS